MKIVKLSAINSTNTFLRDLARASVVDNYTVVVTENQTKGKGQFDNEWISERGKNLTFSMLCRFEDLNILETFYLNCAVSLAIYKVLKQYIPAKLTIKWPNDILSFQKKICGILIENTVSIDKVQYAIIGIGLNVNQQNFPDNVPNASSLRLLTGNHFDKDVLLKKLIVELKIQLALVADQQFQLLKRNYEKVLYRKDEPAMFRNDQNGNFMGKILGITKQGNLIVERDNDTVETYDLKEIEFI
tara:strand:- start:8763 stop:9494 length:732 start_codon:yes stop_codon:yes gene_type:complete